jgi:signal transduction histidine kinase
VLVLPFLRSAYRAPALHVALETANALIALLVGYLVYGRFRQNRRTRELLVVLAMGTVAVANLLLTAVPFAVELGRGEDISRWAGVAIRLVGTVLLTTAALVPPTATSRAGRAGALALGPVAAVAILGVAATIWGQRLPPVVDFSATVDDPLPPLSAAHPAMIGIQALGVLMYSVAAVAFTRQSARTHDELFRWVGAACLLGAFASAHYLLFPSLYSDYVYSGDIFRLGFYLLLLVGAAREIESYWQLRAQAAVLEDRRRMARDLHDGLAQELAYLWSQSQTLAGRAPDAAAAKRIGGAGGRVLGETRRAIAALTRPLDEPFVRVLQQVADDLAIRYDVKIRTELDPAVEISAQHGEALVRIVTEAVRNAVRHGQAAHIDLALTAAPRSLVITDDGRGFATRPLADGLGSGFGLTSMLERARALGAGFTVTSSPGQGTIVRVTWP